MQSSGRKAFLALRCICQRKEAIQDYVIFQDYVILYDGLYIQLMIEFQSPEAPHLSERPFDSRLTTIFLGLSELDMSFLLKFMEAIPYSRQTVMSWKTCHTVIRQSCQIWKKCVISRQAELSYVEDVLHTCHPVLFLR